MTVSVARCSPIWIGVGTSFRQLTLVDLNRIVVFALVTASGSLIIYNMHVPMRAMAKIAAHTVDATCLDWHPTRPYVVATGGAGDRCVKGTCSEFISWLVYLLASIVDIVNY